MDHQRIWQRASQNQGTASNALNPLLSLQLDLQWASNENLTEPNAVRKAGGCCDMFAIQFMRFMHQSCPNIFKLCFDSSRTSSPSRFRWKRNIVSLQSYARIRRPEILWRVFNHTSLIVIVLVGQCDLQTLLHNLGIFFATSYMQFWQCLCGRHSFR